MLYSMLIVEDERWEREGLVELWAWDELAIEIAGTAVDGIDGYEKALQLRPDIIITDIRMPGLTGLEMVKKIRPELPDVRVVVLTGYSDYEYTREAITLHADDYVLKPIEEDDLRRTMLQVVRKCESIQARRMEEQEMMQRVQLGEQIALEKMLSDLLYNRGDAGQLVRELQEKDELLLSAGFAVYAIAPTVLISKTALRRIIAQPCYIVGCTELENGLAVVVPLGLGGSEMNDEEEDQLLLDRLIKHWENDVLQLPTIGAGEPVTSLALAGKALRQALNAAHYGVFYGELGVVTAAMEEEARQRFNARSHKFLSEWQELSRQLKLHMLSLQDNLGSDVLERMFELLGECRGAGKEYISSLLSTLLLDLSLLEDEQQTTSSKYQAHELLGMKRLDELCERVQAAVAAIFAKVETKRMHKDDYIVDKAIRLIEGKYGAHELCLTMLAEEVFVSPNHLGMLFKKATGVTVLQYITGVRMQKAEELLRTTKRKVAEVAEQVGIPNHSYFSTVFKQKHGMSPGEYQELMQR